VLEHPGLFPVAIPAANPLECEMPFHCQADASIPVKNQYTKIFFGAIKFQQLPKNVQPATWQMSHAATGRSRSVDRQLVKKLDW